MNNNTVFYCSPHILAQLPKNTPVLLAFSGGMDSSVLLSLLSEDAKANGFTLHTAHFNHHIRGDEAERDAKFCESESKRHGAIFHLGEADVPHLAKLNGTSLEAEGRAQRYAFFEKIMREYNIPILVTAHHADDNAESILLHIIRGSGLGGISGILPCRDFADGLFIVRPLLRAEKQEIIEYCERENISFVTDSTNDDTTYTRNFVRANIIPYLKQLQPNVCEAFSRLARNSFDDNELLSEMACQFIESECSGKSDIPLSTFNSIHRALKSRVLSQQFNKHCGSTLEFVHINALIELCEKAEPHSKLSLPCGITAKIENGTLRFDGEKEQNIPPISLDFSVGTFKTECGTLITVCENPQGDEGKGDIYIDVKSAFINKSAHFRSKLDGDTVRCGGMSKKVKKLYNEKNIPLDMRKKIPLLVVNGEILWIPSVTACDKLKMDKIKSGDGFFRIAVKFENN